MNGIERLSKEIAKATKGSKTKPYDTKGIVRSVKDGKAMVHFYGGVDETPVDLTINAKVGDEVVVRASGGRAFIVGNGSAPPTDDTKAEQVERKLDKATQVIDGDLRKVYKGVGDLNTLVRESADGVEVGKVNSQGGYVAGHTLISSEDDEYQVIDENGNVVARFGASATIGKEDEVHSTVGSDSFSIADGNGETLFDVTTYEKTVSSYASVYKGDGSSSSYVTFNLRFEAKHGSSVTDVSKITSLTVYEGKYTPSVGNIGIISNGAYVNGSSGDVIFSADYKTVSIKKTWFSTWAPAWNTNKIYMLFDSPLQTAQTVKTASVKVGNCYPTEDYKLCAASDNLDGDTCFTVGGDGEVNASGGYSVAGNPLFTTRVFYDEVVTVAPSAYEQHPIYVQIPNGYTPVGVVGWAVGNASVDGVGASYISTYQVYLQGGTHVNFYIRNNGDSLARLKLTVRVLFASTGIV